MEIKKIVPLSISPQLKDKMDRDLKHKEEASKSIGDYLISITNNCFDYCINTDSIYFTKNEEKCIKNYFEKYKEVHLYTLKKFKDIDQFTSINTLERSADYGDYHGFLKFLFQEDNK